VKFSREHAYDVAIAAAAERWKVPVALIKAIIAKESEFQPRATALDRGDAARGGSYGLMQLSLETAHELGFRGTVQDLYDAAVNVNLGARYLRDLLSEATAGGYGVDSVISAYNAGNSAYRRGDGRRVGSIAHATPAEAARVPFINEDDYVRPVLELMRYFERSESGIQP
jgi:soluble lytic murein transglycosylase-like protein